MQSLVGKRVTVMGLGRHGGGVAAARYLALAGAEVTVTDLLTAEALATSVAELSDAPIARFHLGAHRAEDFRAADLVLINPAVRPGDPFVELAQRAGVAITSEIELFLRACPGTVVGVTGSNGKSSTAAMTASCLTAAGRRTWLGGNIGRSLLADLPQMTPDDLIVLELSSFQLAQLNATAPLPRMAILTNCTPNHLDWHPDFADYRAAKQRLLAAPADGAIAVLNAHDAEVRTWPTSRRVAPLVELADVPTLRVRGEHQRINAACAAAAALALGCPWAAVRQGLESYAGLPHRLELVAERDGCRFFNDSMATTPESVIAGLRALESPTWLLVGGKNKGADFTELAVAIAARATGVCCYGGAGDVLQQAIGGQLEQGATGLLTRENLHRCASLPEAMGWCWSLLREGEAMLLSPGCSSQDQFRDYRQRAEVFAATAAALPARA